MLTSLAVTLLLITAQAPPKQAVLPDTPQGKHVAAYIAAFNSGDQKKFLAVHETDMVPDMLKRRPEAERVQMFERMRGDFGKLTVTRVLKATPEKIQLAIPTREGDEATFTFDFETTAPYRINGIGVDVRAGG